MDKIEAAVQDTVHFSQEKNLKAAYYKAVEGIFEILGLLEKGFIYQLKPNQKCKLRGSDIEGLLQTLLILMNTAEKCLPNVIELTADAAKSYARASYPTPRTGWTWRKKRPENISGPDMSPAVSTTNSTSSKETFGFEELSLISTEDRVPSIPASIVEIEICQVIFQSQVIMQKMLKFKEASPKARSNAAYLGGLRDQLEALVQLLRRKISLKKQASLGLEGRSLLNFSAKDTAYQLTLIDMLLFQSIKLEPLKSLGKISAEGIENLQFYQDFMTFVTSWVQYEILGRMSLEGRIQAMVHWLGVCNSLTSLRSFNMLAAVAQAINSSNVQKAADIIDGLLNSQKFERKKLQDRLNVANNYAKFRSEIEDQKDAKTCLPYLDIYLNEIQQLNQTGGATQKDNKEAQVAKIVEFLAQLQLKATLYHETIEPIPVLQHFILSRPYKNILELDNLAISRSSGGGRFTPDPNKEFEPVPDVTIHGDRGTIMLGNIQKLIIEQK